MNDYAREVLVQAGLSNHPQVKGLWHAVNGDCALGVLHIALHGTRNSAVKCLLFRGVLTEFELKGALAHSTWMDTTFGLSSSDRGQIADLNDAGVDFIGIARKVGMGESA